MVNDLVKNACLNARRPGACQYVDDNGPCCVVAQIAFACNHTIEEMLEWKNDTVHTLRMRDLIPEDNNSFLYRNRNSLYSLQAFWDCDIKKNLAKGDDYDEYYDEHFDEDAVDIDEARRLLLEKAETLNWV